MKREIYDWYAKRHYPYHRLIKIGVEKQKLTKLQLEAAMLHCYLRIQEGKQVQDIELARYVFNVARDIDVTEYGAQYDQLYQAEQTGIKFKKLFIGSFIYILVSHLTYFLHRIF